MERQVELTKVKLAFLVIAVVIIHTEESRDEAPQANVEALLNTEM